MNKIEKPRIFYLLIFIVLFFSMNFAEINNVDEFGKIVIMEQGRVKPLDTFAQNILKELSGKDKYNGKKALSWFIKVLFDPESTFDDRVFLITNLDVLNSIGVKRIGKARNRYSYNQLYQGLDELSHLATNALKRKRANRDDIENRIIVLYHKIYVYNQLVRSLMFFRHKNVSQVTMSLKNPLTIFPSSVNERGWISPLESYMKNNMSIEKSKKIVYLYDMYNAYVSGQQLKFDKTVKVFKEIVKYENMSIDEGKINLEIFYNSLDPFYKSKFFFGFSIIFLLLSFMFFKTFFYRVSFLLLLTGFFMTLSGTVLRMYIRARPPVTNLYETFIFTALITALLGLILELFRKKNIGIFTGGFSGFVMLMIASKYALDGDTMGMLVAVLDSNFWLAFHVITIILGYSGIILSGVIGHIYLIIDVFNSKNKSLLDDIFSAVYSIQAFGLVFTFLGTVLGGIWADQSWGRFWGWDPKENGALLVLLWSVILFHAKIAKMIKRKGFVFGTIIGVIFVSLAWFGVNLLGVGLHTYGFTSGVARGLFSFVGFELFFILLIGSFSKFGNIRNSNSNVKNSKK